MILPESREHGYIPIGAGERGKQETLPADRVGNELSWINPEIKAPFRLELGKPLPGAAFLTPDETGEKRLEVVRGHWRTALLGQVIFQDAEGRYYRDIDIKGSGGFKWRAQEWGGLEVVGQRPRRFHFDVPTGIADKGYITKDKNRSEEFLAAGIRTYRYIAIAELREIISESGEHVSVERATQLGFIPPDIKPVIALRAWGTRFRVADVIAPVQYHSEDKLQEIRERELNDARVLVAQELRVDPSGFGMDDYLLWFARTFGEQVARMHRFGWTHNFISIHNVTLDCRLVDLDGVRRVSTKIKDLSTDRSSAIDVLSFLIFAVKFFSSAADSLRHRSRSDIVEIFSSAYREEYAKGKERPEGYSP
jgi:tRNA A-37 threonylcarbamoyl transferase component Bud32